MTTPRTVTGVAQQRPAGVSIARQLPPAPAAASGPWTPLAPQLSRRLRRRRAGAPCLVQAAATPGRFDDLQSSPQADAADVRSGMSTFDDMWREQIRAMERAQSEMADIQRAMDQRFAAAEAEARQLEQQASSSSSSKGGERLERFQQQDGRCGYRWQRSYQRSGGSFQEWRSESFTVIGVEPPGCVNVGMRVAPPSALHLGPLSGVGLLAAAAVAGFWVAATAAFHRRFKNTVYRESSRWPMLLLWPVLLVISSEFRAQFLAAVRGRQAAGTDEQRGGQQGAA